MGNPKTIDVVDVRFTHEARRFEMTCEISDNTIKGNESWHDPT